MSDHGPGSVWFELEDSQLYDVYAMSVRESEPHETCDPAHVTEWALVRSKCLVEFALRGLPRILDQGSVSK